MRRKNDQYFSPRWAIDALTRHDSFWDLLPDHDDLSDLTFFEPCKGNGALSDQLANVTKQHIVTCDIDPHLNPEHVLDFYTDEAQFFWDSHPCPYENRVIITNPPYKSQKNLSADFVKLALTRAPTVCVYLGSNFVEPCFDRIELLEYNLTQITFTPRFSFTGDGKTDSKTCGWFIFSKENSQEPQVDFYTKADIWNWEATQKPLYILDQSLEDTKNHLEKYLLSITKKSNWQLSSKHQDHYTGKHDVFYGCRKLGKSFCKVVVDISAESGHVDMEFDIEYQ